MLNMKYCRTENVIAALREWEDDPGTDEHLHHELYELCSRIAADAGLVPRRNANGDLNMSRNGGGYVRTEAIPTYRPLVTACAEHGISRSVAFELARLGKLETFTIGTRRYVVLESLRTLPERLAANDAAGGES